MGLTRGYLLLVLALWASPLQAQTPPAVVTASLTSGVCTTEGATSAGCVTLNVAGQASLGIQVTGTWVGTLTFKSSIDRTTFATLQCTPPNSSSSATTTTGNGQWSCSVAGLAMAEVIFSAYTSGTAVVTLQSALAGGGSGGGGGGAASSVTINDPSVTSQKAAVNASGQLSITCANCSGSGASAVDESTFTQGTNSVAPMGLLFKNAYTALTTGQVGIPQGTSDGALFINVFKVGGTAVDTNSGNKSAGTQRFVLATDQPNLTTPLNIAGTVTANAGTNLNTSALALDATLTGRLPAGASPADAETNTSASLSRVGAYPFVFNGTTWDRLRGDTTNGVFANVKTSVLPTGAATETTLGTRLADATFTGRMPAGASPANGESNTSTSLSRIGGYNFIFNGTTWDRWTGAVTNGGTFATQSAITAASGSIASGAVASGAFASGAIGDGADVTLGAKADAKSTATDTTAITIMQVLKEISAMEQAPASRAVTNTGTFADQSTLQTQTDTVMIGGVNIKEINGVTPLMGAGATGTGALRVNDVATSATGAAPPASGQFIVGLGSGATGGLLIGITVCDKDFDIDITTATTTLAVTGVSGRQVRICHFDMLATATDTVAFIEGTGATCGTGTAGMLGSSTAGHGMAFAANGGAALGSGIGEILTTATTGDSVCLVTSAATQLAGHIKYAIY